MKSVLLLLKSNSQGRCCVWPYGLVLFLSCEPQGRPAKGAPTQLKRKLLLAISSAMTARR